jgi:hypothetical protein
MDGPAPAIFNAVRNATGLAITSLPLLPEHLLREYGSAARSRDETATRRNDVS